MLFTMFKVKRILNLEGFLCGEGDMGKFSVTEELQESFGL